MQFKIEHETLYRYDAAVRLAPHVLRLNPRPEGVRVTSQLLRVTPRPLDQTDFVDAFGNRLTRVAFEGPTDTLRIESHIELETLSSGFRPAVEASLPALPWPDVLGDGLDVYRRQTPTEAPVQAFAADLAARSLHAPMAFLSALSADLYSNMDRAIRWEGDARSPAVTLATRQGACRDITVLFLASCRSLGLPARFVSGYQARAQTPDGQRHLHAWAEVHLPGVGWSGYDATHGVAATDGHVALCAAPDQASTMPVEGSYWGPSRLCTLDAWVRIATS